MFIAFSTHFETQEKMVYVHIFAKQEIRSQDVLVSTFSAAKNNSLLTLQRQGVYEEHRWFHTGT